MKQLLYTSLFFLTFGMLQSTAQSVSDSQLVPQVWFSEVENPYQDLDKYTLLDLQNQNLVTRIAGDQVFISRTQDVRNETIAVVEEVSYKEDCFSAYPNPAVDFTKLEWNPDIVGDDDKFTIQILDMFGKEVEELILDRYDSGATIDLAGYPAGMFLIQIISGNGVPMCSPIKIEVSGY